MQLIVNDHLHVACSVIEKTPMDHAVGEVEDGFTAAYNLRRTHRQVSRSRLSRNQDFVATVASSARCLTSSVSSLMVFITSRPRCTTNLSCAINLLADVSLGRDGGRFSAISRPGSANDNRLQGSSTTDSTLSTLR